MAEVIVTRNLPAPAAQVWARIGPFCSLADWSPAVKRCDCDGESVGSIRKLYVGDDGVFVEKLLDYDQDARWHRYSIESSPLPVDGYVATLSVQPDDDDSSVVTWSATFQPTSVSEAEAVNLVNAIFTSGLTALERAIAPQEDTLASSSGGSGSAA